MDVARAAHELLQRMQRCGVSRFHPDPVGACEEAEARDRVKGTARRGDAGMRGRRAARGRRCNAEK